MKWKYIVNHWTYTWGDIWAKHIFPLTFLFEQIFKFKVSNYEYTVETSINTICLKPFLCTNLADFHVQHQFITDIPDVFVSLEDFMAGSVTVSPNFLELDMFMTALSHCVKVAFSSTFTVHILCPCIMWSGLSLCMFIHKP